MLLLHIAQLASHTIQSVPHISVLLPAPCGGAAGTDNVGTALKNTADYIQTDARIVGGVVFLICVIIAGIMRMIAFGSERRVAVSNMALTAAVVGLGIIIISPIIASAMGQWITGGCTTTQISALMHL